MTAELAFGTLLRRASLLEWTKRLDPSGMYEAESRNREKRALAMRRKAAKAAKPAASDSVWWASYRKRRIRSKARRPRSERCDITPVMRRGSVSGGPNRGSEAEAFERPASAKEPREVRGEHFRPTRNPEAQTKNRRPAGEGAAGLMRLRAPLVIQDRARAGPASLGACATTTGGRRCGGLRHPR